MTTPMGKDEKWKTFSIRVETPDGTMFVHIMEDEREIPQKCIIHIGKAGSSLMAWCDACARLVSKLLPDVHGAIEELSGLTTAKFRRQPKGEIIRSGPEGIAYALLKYRGEKYKEHKPPRRSGAASIGDYE